MAFYRLEHRLFMHFLKNLATLSMDRENVTPKGSKWDRDNVIPVSFLLMKP